MVYQFTNQEELSAFLKANTLVAIIGCPPGASPLLHYEELSGKLPSLKFAEIVIEEPWEGPGNILVEPGHVTFVRKSELLNPPVPVDTQVIEHVASQWAEQEQ